MKKTTLFTLSVIVILSACQNSTNNPDIDPILGSRSELLENVTNNIIIPAHENLKDELIHLNAKTQDFKNNPNALSLSQLRNAYVQTYISWQSVEMFAVGKAEEIDYAKSMNTYPCNTTQINNNLESQLYDLNQANWPSWSAQGFPTLDYMLYGIDVDSNQILNYYTAVDGIKYLNYLNAVVSQMQYNTNLVIEYWQTNKENFIGSDGNTAVSSLNVLTNDFIYYYEKGLRANKIGIPCGRWNGFETYEIGVEAYYRADISKLLTLASLDACKNFFIGKGINSGIRGFSYEDILAENGDANLSADIINALNQADMVISSLDNNFRLQLLQNDNSMLDAYDALQAVVPLLKVQMLSSLTITVDYEDSDGD
ncbi:MAG: peptidase M75 superfamily protein [Flavobacteriales bacterium]|nr:peptidase M75 superfamily protein [Flavobacteriales bacterium]|tara:strand:- start:1727 stop:2833 length:1107 start_codon:yes stop_codon:yes gene_type:complete